MSIARHAAALVSLGLLLATGCGDIPTSTKAVAEPDTTTLQQAVEACGLHTPNISLGDQGHSLSINNKGSEDISGAFLDEIVCALDFVDVPDAVLQRMSATRALDGMQDAEWDGFTATWTFHPDNGLDVIIQQR